MLQTLRHNVTNDRLGQSRAPNSSHSRLTRAIPFKIIFLCRFEDKDYLKRLSRYLVSMPVKYTTWQEKRKLYGSFRQEKDHGKSLLDTSRMGKSIIS